MPLDMRIFIAFPVTTAIAKTVVEWQKLIQKRYPFLTEKWVAPSNLHITLEFLGTITALQLDKVRETLMYQTKRVRPFLFETGALTVFPSARTLVCEVAEKRTLFSYHLRNVVHEELLLLGITKDSKLWKPHLTLARATGEIDVRALQVVAPEKQEWLVDKVQLIESNTTSNGSRYTILNEYPLFQ